MKKRFNFLNHKQDLLECELTNNEHITFVVFDDPSEDMAIHHAEFSFYADHFVISGFFKTKQEVTSIGHNHTQLLSAYVKTHIHLYYV